MGVALFSVILDRIESREINGSDGLYTQCVWKEYSTISVHFGFISGFMKTKALAIATLLSVFAGAAFGAAPARGIAGGLLSVQGNSGEFSSISPLVSAKADLFEAGQGRYSFQIHSGKTELSFEMDAPRESKNRARVFEGRSSDGMKIVLQDDTTCAFEACRGPLWRARITRPSAKGEAPGELLLSGDVTLYPEVPVQLELAGKVGTGASPAKPPSEVSLARPADIGTLAPEGH